jgi:hypothetical protein
MPWGGKKKITETKVEVEVPEVSTNLYVAQSHLTHSCIQKLENKPEIVPATTLAENFMVSKPDEVRWSVHVLESR